MDKETTNITQTGRTSITGELKGNPVIINFADTTSDFLLVQVKRQLANSHMNKAGADKEYGDFPG